MADTIKAIAVGRLSLSRISYHCDLQKDSGLIIPLGAMAEITLGSVRVLGLIARTGLFDEELEAIGHLYRPKLAAPFELLSREFEWAWNSTEGGKALNALARRHSESMFFSPPKIHDVREILALPLQGMADFARNELRTKRDREFLELLIETWAKPTTVPQEELARLAA